MSPASAAPAAGPVGAPVGAEAAGTKGMTAGQTPPSAPAATKSELSSPRNASFQARADVQQLKNIVEELKARNEQLVAALVGAGVPVPDAENRDSRADDPSHSGHVNQVRGLANRRKRGAAWATDDANGGTNEDGEARVTESHPKSESQTALIMSALRQTVPFNSLEESQQLLIANYMAPLTVADGEALTREGEEGDRAFLLESGKLNVRVGDEDRGNVQPGQIVGELALICKRSGCPPAHRVPPRC